MIIKIYQGVGTTLIESEILSGLATPYSYSANRKKHCCIAFTYEIVFNLRNTCIS